MRTSTLISVALLTSALLISGCSINRADSLRMLDKRADYENSDDSKVFANPGLKEGGIDGFSNGPVPVRTRPKVASIWIHPHEMASHDYFWGGWMSVVIEADHWLLSSPGEMPAVPNIRGIKDVTGINLSKPSAKIPGARPKLKNPLK